MSINQPIRNEIAVDRREETVVTQQPGYAATERVTHDLGAERQQRLFQIVRIVWSVLGFLEILLGLRVVLKLMAANPESGFAALIYGITELFVAPFASLVRTPSVGGATLELTTLIAMGMYALFTWGIFRVVQIVTDRYSSRTIMRSTREQTGVGVERTTHSTRSG